MHSCGGGASGKKGDPCISHIQICAIRGTMTVNKPMVARGPGLICAGLNLFSDPHSDTMELLFGCGGNLFRAASFAVAYSVLIAALRPLSAWSVIDSMMQGIRAKTSISE